MLLFANKARSTLTNSVTSAAGQVATVTASTGALFVGVGGVATSTTNPMRCVLTAVDANGNDTGAFEVVEVVRSGDNLTLQARGLEGTTPSAWNAGAMIECRPTAEASQRLTDSAAELWPRAGRSGKWFKASPWNGSIVNTFSANFGGDATYGDIATYPLRFRFDTVIDRLGVYVSSAGAAGVKTRIALYAENPVTGLAGTLITSSGDMDCSTIGSKEYLYSATLVGGVRYWLAHATSGACGYAGYGDSSDGIPYGCYNLTYQNDSTPSVRQAYGAFPTDLSAAAFYYIRSSGFIALGVSCP